MTELKRVTGGFLPLTDVSILAAAREIGFAKEQGIDLVLERETSWANIRDRMAIGHFDIAHMLAPMPIASNLGITPFDQEIIAPMALGLGGNAVTVSSELFSELSPTRPEALKAGASLKRAIENRRAAGKPKLRFGVVHPHSAHNFELRYFFSASGIKPDEDVEIVILPPSLMPAALERQKIDGFCVGEPWNTVSADAGHGRILTTKNEIWSSSPEKVLGVRGGWAQQNEATLASLLRACYAASQWCADHTNRQTLAYILSRPDYLDVDPTIISRSLAGESGFEPYARAATFPWISHAMWFYSQMVRWGQIVHNDANANTARSTYRPDIYRSALKGTGAAIPAASSKVEGALSEETVVGAGSSKLALGPDGFFDNRIFDPDQIDEYIASQSSET
ncbi:MAG: CmpA/NrtA family ABC transporter substrate-binding protein [Pseudomonadota bacterium]